MEAEFAGRAIIREFDDILEIKIPSKKSIFAIIFLCVWLIGWFLGETFALSTIFFNSDIDSFDKIFVSVWVIAWTFGGLFAFGILNWFLFGYELIIVENGNLKISKKIWFINLKKEYEIREIKDISVVRNFSSPAAYYNIHTITSQFGRIKFDYGMKTIKFAINIDEAEAKMILEKLKRNHNFREFNFNIMGENK
ncbi:hypothetical protein [Oceanivirga salmonicida]|uniref:hypothetical protein n=1 Tax=Oceanivirga salmonicida TaxID=1769291 RepID=UPI000835A6AD|nr:hypothetical protein [Oceanivirga salmonicida]